MAANCHRLSPLRTPTEIELLFPHNSNTENKLMRPDPPKMFKDGRQWTTVHTGRSDIARERRAMAKGTRTSSLGAAGEIITSQSEKGPLSSPLLPATRP